MLFLCCLVMVMVMTKKKTVQGLGSLDVYIDDGIRDNPR